MRNEETKSLYVTTHDYTSLTKVGVSKEPIKRLNAIKTSVGAEMFIYYESPLLINWREVELTVLNHFSKKRASGEWINETPENIIKFIKTIEHTFNNPNYYYLSEHYIEPQFETISENTEDIFKRYLASDIVYRDLEHIQNGVYRDENFNFFVCYHIGDSISTVIFNVYKTANYFAKTITKRIVYLDIENKKYIKNSKFRIKNE